MPTLEIPKFTHVKGQDTLKNFVSVNNLSNIFLPTVGMSGYLLVASSIFYVDNQESPSPPTVVILQSCLTTALSGKFLDIPFNLMQ